MKIQIETDKSPSSPILSQAIQFENLIFVSGQVPNTLDGKLINDSVEAMLDQIMLNIQNILETADSSLDKIIKLSIFMTDIALLPEINKIYPKYFKGILPAREAICVKALPLQASIEISVTAHK